MGNNIADEDSEWGRYSICGYGARLAYVDRSGNERIKILIHGNAPLLLMEASMNLLTLCDITRCTAERSKQSSMIRNMFIISVRKTTLHF